MYDYGARFYDPSLSLWTSVDQLTAKMPGQGAYNYAFNNPIRYIDPDGNAPKDFIVLLWRSRLGDQGHAALAIQDHKRGGYMLYEVMPDDTRNIDSYVNNPHNKSSGYVSSMYFKDEESLLKYKDGADGALKFSSTAAQDSEAMGILNSDVTEVSQGWVKDLDGRPELGNVYGKNQISYSLTDESSASDSRNCTYSCSSFVSSYLEVLYGVGSGKPENIKTNSFSKFGYNLPSLDLNAYTPNSLYNNLKGQGQTMGNKSINFVPFIDSVTGSKLDLNPEF